MIARWQRISDAVARPRCALERVAEAAETSHALGDLVLLLVIWVAASLTGNIVTAVWMVSSGDVAGGIQSLLSTVSIVLVPDLFIVAGTGVVIFALSGARRWWQRDVDQALVAFIPAVVVSLVYEAIARWIPSLAMMVPSTVVAALGWGWFACLSIKAILLNRASAGFLGKTKRGASYLAPIVVSAVAIAAVGGGIFAVAVNPGSFRPMVRGDMAPRFSLPMIAAGGTRGPIRVLEATRGEVVLLDFWATWCQPCRTTMPVVDRIARDYGGRGLSVWSINTEGWSMASRAYAVARQLAPNTELLGDNGAVSQAYRVTTIPQLVLIDRGGRIRYLHRGGGGHGLYKALSKKIDALLVEAPPAAGSHGTEVPKSGAR